MSVDSFSPNQYFDFLPVPAGIIQINRSNFPFSFRLDHVNQAFHHQFNTSADAFPCDLNQFFSNTIDIVQLTQLIDKKDFNTKISLSFDQKTWQFSFNPPDETHLVFILNDISTVEKTKAKLTETSRQLDETQSMANLGYWSINHQNNEFYWSKGMYTILSAHEDEIPSFNSFLNYVYPDDRKMVENTFKEALQSKSGYEITHRMITRNGLVKHLKQKCYSTFNQNGTPIQSIGIINDITIFEFTKMQMLQNQAMFESVFEHSPMAIMLINKNLKPIFTNHRFRVLTGYQPADMLSVSISDLFYPNEAPVLQEKLTRIFEDHQQFQLDEVLFQTRSGNTIWMKLSVSEVNGFDQKSGMAILLLQDITAEKTARELLEQSEEQYRTLIENSSYGIGMLDQQFQPLFFNTAMHSMLGYTRQEYEKLDFKGLTFTHPTDQKRIEKTLVNGIGTKPFSSEYRILMKNGSYLFCSFTVIPVKYKNQPALLIFQQDVSQRKQAEMQSEEYRLFLETVLDNLPVAFFAKSTPDYNYIYWNKAIESFTGIPAEEAIGHTDFDLCALRNDAQRFMEEDEKVKTTKKRVENEHEYTLPTGSVKILRTIKTLYEPPYGHPVILGLSMDITRLKEAEQQIEASTQMLKEAQKIAKLGYWEYDVVKDLFFDNIENRQILGTDKLGYFISLNQLTDITHPSDQTIIKSEFKKCIEHNISVENIVRFHTGEKIKHVMLNLKPITNTDQKVIKIRGTSLDITRIRKSEMALRESETKLRQAQHIAKVGYWDYDYSQKTINFSDEVWRILSIEPQSSSPNLLVLIQHVHPDDRENIKNLFFESRSNSCSLMAEFRIITPGGLTKFIEARGTFVRSVDGKIDRSMGTFQDISPIKQSQLQLVRTKNQLQEIQQLSKTAFIEFSLSQNKIINSSNLVKLLGLNPDYPFIQLIDYYQMVHPSEKETIIKTTERARLSKSTYNIQYRLVKPDNSIVYVNEIGQLCCESENDDSLLIVIQDITDIRLKEIDFNISNMVLDQLRRLIGIGTWSYNLSNYNIFASENIHYLFHFEPITHLDDLFKYIHPDDLYSVKIAVLQSIRNKVPFNLSFRFTSNVNQQTIYIQLVGLIVQNNHEEWVIEGFVFDHTNIFDARNQLTETIKLYNSITDNALFAISIYQDNKHIYVNPKWEQLIGVSKEDTENKLSYFDIIKPDQAQRISALINSWDQYELKEYNNLLKIEPIYAKNFSATVFIKKLIINQKPAFLTFFIEAD